MIPCDVDDDLALFWLLRVVWPKVVVMVVDMNDCWLWRRALHRSLRGLLNRAVETSLHRSLNE